MKYNDERWDYWMNKMKKKSRLSEENYKLVVEYVKDLRKGG